MRHGRRSVDEKLKNWGLEGPWIGPLKWVHITYLSTINVCFIDGVVTEPMDSSDPLHFVGDMLFYEGVYYGDWDLSLVEDSRHE
jgi:hypothetical protein